MFQLTAIVATFIYTWVFNGSGGSLFIVILLHAAGNAASGFLTDAFGDLPYDGWAATIIDGGALNVISFTTTAVVLITLTRGRLSYRAEEQKDSQVIIFSRRQDRYHQALIEPRLILSTP